MSCKANLAVLLVALSATNLAAQAGPTPPGANRDLIIATEVAAQKLNLLEGRLAAIEKKLLLAEQSIAKLQTTESSQGAAIDKLKAQVSGLQAHTHDVTIYSISHDVTKVKDVYGNEKQVVVPGPSFGNPKGQTGAPKVTGVGTPFGN
jgi:uncharacterized coiled-coil protein SlyX